MARIRAYNQDMNMMNSCNSQERTLQEFIEMGYVICRLALQPTIGQFANNLFRHRKKTGFKFEKLWDAGEAGLVEFTTA
jgi:hypothetical protein